MFKIFKILVLSSLGLLFHSPLNAAPNQLPLLDRVVATVNQEAIPESELNQQFQLLVARLKQGENPNLPSEDVLRKQLLEKIILEKLQLQMAKEEKISVDETQLKQAINEIASRDNMSLPQLQSFLETQGITYKQFQESIKNEMTISKLQQKEIGQFISISASELDNFINSPQGQDQTGAEYRLRHILIALPESPTQNELAVAEKKAKDLIKKLKSGGDFGENALASSSGEQALKAGDLGWRKSTELPTLFSKVVPTLPVGAIHGPIKNTSGFHIIKLVDKRIDGATLDNPEAVKNKAMDALYQRKFEEQLTIWLKRVRDEAQIENYLNEG